MQDGEDDRAYALLHKALEAGPRVAFIWSNLGTLLSRNGLTLLAETAFEEALLISPDELSAMSNLQRLYSRQERHAEARELGERLGKYRNRNPYYHALQGEQAFGQGNYRQAVSHYKDAIRLNGNVHDFFFGLSESYAKLGKSKAASRAANKAQIIAERNVVPAPVRQIPSE
jgi:tetratricopeptide (TPR) repeat protein